MIVLVSKARNYLVKYFIHQSIIFFIIFFLIDFGVFKKSHSIYNISFKTFAQKERKKYVNGIKKRNIFHLIYFFSSFSYLYIGLNQIKNITFLQQKNIYYPWKLDSFYLIIQGFFSFLTDSYFFSTHKFFYVLDVSFAKMIIINQLIKITSLKSKKIPFFLSFLINFKLLHLSKINFRKKNLKKTLIYHSCWHYVPLLFYLVFIRISE